MPKFNYKRAVMSVFAMVLVYGLVFPTVVALCIIGVLPASMIQWGIGSMLPVYSVAFLIGGLTDDSSPS